MGTPVRDGRAMVAGMNPARLPGEWAFIHDPAATPALLAAALATFHEEEGLSLVLPRALAEAAGHVVDQPMARIVLRVHSALDGVGLTAAVAGALAARGIACNVIAAFHHDHLFVPLARADEALAALEQAQAQAREGA